MAKTSFPKPTPLRAPRKGPGVAEHPQPRQRGHVPTIGVPPKAPSYRVPG